MIPLGRWGYIRPGIASSRQPLRIAIVSDCRYDRRTLLKNALVGLAALPASGLIREAAAQGALPHVDEKETLAVSLAYVQDVTKVDPSKTPQFKPGSHCGNSCSHQLPR